MSSLQRLNISHHHFVSSTSAVGAAVAQPDENLENPAPVLPCKIQHNSSPDSCYVAVLLNMFRDDHLYQYLISQSHENPNEAIAHELREAIIPCVDKVRQGSTEFSHNVICVNEIVNIQKVLNDHGIIENGFEDPMEVLFKILHKLDPDASLFQERTTTHYPLEGNDFEEVTLTAEDLGPQGKIVANLNPLPNPQICIYLRSSQETLNLEDELVHYQQDDREHSTTTVHALIEENRYRRYHVKPILITRTLVKAPASLILELSGRFDGNAQQMSVEFKESMKLKTEDGVSHYYELQQVNCHKVNHEYAFLKIKGVWYLSDDMQPVRLAFLLEGSEDTNHVCQFGKTFIYKEVSQENFDESPPLLRQTNNNNKIPDALNSPIMVRKTDLERGIPSTQGFSEEPSPQRSEYPSIDLRLSGQLEGLIKISEEGSDPKLTLQLTLLESTSGIGSFPKEETLFDDRHFSVGPEGNVENPASLLPCEIEHSCTSTKISSDESQENPYVNSMVFTQLEGLIKICEKLLDPNLSSQQTLLELSWGVGSIPKEKKFSKEWSDIISGHHWVLLEDISRQITNKCSICSTTPINELISQLFQSTKNLKRGFERLIDLEKSKSKSSEGPSSLSSFEDLFQSDFDSFVIEQVENTIQVILSSLGEKDPIKWLRKEHRIKALFRTVEVIGEASKIISDKAKKSLPTLFTSAREKPSSVNTEPLNRNRKPLWGKLRNKLPSQQKPDLGYCKACT